MASLVLRAPFRWPSLCAVAVLALSSSGSSPPPALRPCPLEECVESLWWEGRTQAWFERVFGGRGYSMMGPIYSPFVIHELGGEFLATLRELDSQHSAPFIAKLPLRDRRAV